MILSIPPSSVCCVWFIMYLFSCETLVAYSVGSIVVLQVIWLGHMAGSYGCLEEMATT